MTVILHPAERKRLEDEARHLEWENTWAIIRERRAIRERQLEIAARTYRRSHDEEPV
jgi:hypothetical protein